VDGQIIDHDIEVSKDSEDFYVVLPGQPTIVRFDPEYTLLADISFDKSNELIKAQIENQDDMIGRLLACRLLESRKTHDSVKQLQNVLQNDPFFGVRIAAVRALAKHESDEAYEVLEKSWKSQSDARVRSEVVSRLAGRFNPRTPVLLAEILEHEANPAIQAAAIKGFGRFHSDTTRQQLIKYLDSESFRNEIAVAAISAIGQLNDSAYTDPLMDVLNRREKDFTSGGFAQGLTTLAQVAKSLDDKAAVREFLVARVNHPKSRVRSAAIKAVGVLGDARALSVLQAFADSSDERIAGVAKQAVDSLRDSKPTAPSELIELRKTVAEMKKQDEKLKAELQEIRDQLKARQ
jgi:aminopeptidase N